jgi:Holliday junction resolvase RusA-like endonuclease
MVRDIASKAMQGRVALEGPIGLDVLVVQTPAASWSKKRKAAAHWVTGRPDCDNVQKLICDSLNNIIWLDDAQVSAIHFERVYSLTQPEHVEVTVHALGESPWTR